MEYSRDLMFQELELIAKKKKECFNFLEKLREEFEDSDSRFARDKKEKVTKEIVILQIKEDEVIEKLKQDSLNKLFNREAEIRFDKEVGFMINPLSENIIRRR